MTVTGLNATFMSSALYIGLYAIITTLCKDTSVSTETLKDDDSNLAGCSSYKTWFSEPAYRDVIEVR